MTTMRIDFLTNRVSAPAGAIGEPAPNEDELAQILDAGLAAPDYNQLTPWRLLTIRGDALNRLGDAFADGLRHNNPAASDDALETLRRRPLRAPLIVVVISSPVEDETVSEREQLLSGGAVAQQILLGANALNFDAVWLTGPMVANPVVAQKLGLADHESIVGFMYIGTCRDGAIEAKRRATTRPRRSDLVAPWTGTVDDDR